jgi:tRNA(His) 5'-end guanylyltransferase
MNERIKELMPKPWVYPFPDRELYTKEQMVHLAETIVRECSNIVLHYTDVDEGAVVMRKQFGVK